MAEQRPHAVHAHVFDHLPSHTALARVNKRLAVTIVRAVGSMPCAWLFALLALAALPAVLTAAFHVTWFPRWLVATGLIALVAWIAQTFLQLVLLSVILVGTNVMAAASDARAARTFADAELVVDRLDTATEGGLRTLLDAVSKLSDDLAGLAEAIHITNASALADRAMRADPALAEAAERTVQAPRARRKTGGTP